MNKENDLINELRQKLPLTFQKYGIQRAVVYFNREGRFLTVEHEVILLIESGLSGIAFCELLNEINNTANAERLSVLDIRHFKQWSEIDNDLALEGTEIYCKEKTKNVINLRYLKEIFELIIKIQGYCREISNEQFEMNNEYYGAAEPPVRCGESHLSELTEPPCLICFVIRLFSQSWI